VDVLIYADTLRSADLRHEIPAAVMDPFLYAEREGDPVAVVSQLDAEVVTGSRPGVKLLFPEDLGLDELLERGVELEEALLEIAVRACARLEIERAAVPPAFPLALADRLRGAGVELRVSRDEFVRRRRSKSETELDGIRRAQRAAEAGMAVAAQMLRDAEAPADHLMLAGEPLTSERIKAAIEGAVTAKGARVGEMIVAHGPQAASGHDTGSGTIASGEPVVVDVWPQDRASACWADMTRTFAAGPAPAEVRDWRALTLEALERAVAAIRPGVLGSHPYGLVCEVFEAAGHPTQRSKPPGTVLGDGFYWGLGHGVGLEVHESPSLGRGGSQTLVTGDVLAVEPGLCRAELGEYRVEDLVLVTDDGAEVLTSFHYDLSP
jgi:Xaa-Pro aminopeptidase